MARPADLLQLFFCLLQSVVLPLAEFLNPAIAGIRMHVQPSPTFEKDWL
jgi:hypothetical protein